MRHQDVEIRSVGDLVNALGATAVAREVLWFRGHARKDWQLTPSLARRGANLQRETELIKRFIQLGVPHLDSDVPANDWEWIFLMQHHRVPTRLLDWSESALAALWFAVNSTDPADIDHDGAFWCLSPLQLNREARYRGRLETELPGFGKDQVLDSYLPDRQDQGPAQNPVAATGPRNSRRMAAQLGKFLMCAEKDKVVDTKKSTLDQYVIEWSRVANRESTIPSLAPAIEILQSMAKVFVEKDKLLRQVGAVILYFHLFRLASTQGWAADIQRSHIESFERERLKSRELGLHFDESGDQS